MSIFHSISGYTPNEYSVYHWTRRPGFNPRLSHAKHSKMMLDATLLNIQHCKVRIKGKVKQSRGKSNALSYTEV